MKTQRIALSRQQWFEIGDTLHNLSCMIADNDPIQEADEISKADPNEVIEMEFLPLSVRIIQVAMKEE